jgi:DNA-binding IclR family transcriptional regulator
MSNQSGNRTKRGGIQSIDRAARILNALASGARRLGVSELAQRLELAPGTVHGLLQALQAHGFVEQDRNSGKYQLGAGLLQLGTSYLDLNELRARSLVHAERLAVRGDAAVRVGVMHGAGVIVVHHVFRPDETLQILEVGAQLPVHASALGKAILAYLPSSVVDDLTAESLPKLTSRTLSARELRAQFESIRERGVARERDEAILGEASVAAPIFDHSGHAVGAVGVVGDTERIVPRGPAKGLVAAVAEAAAGISRELGARSWPGPVGRAAR